MKTAVVQLVKENTKHKIINNIEIFRFNYFTSFLVSVPHFGHKIQLGDIFVPHSEQLQFNEFPQ